MKNIFKFVFFTVLSVLFIFLLLEIFARVTGTPKGAARYIETVVLKNQLSVSKPKNELRIFTYGESTMHGSHYWPASNPARWLEAYLQDFLPGKKIKVINFARMGQNSFFIHEAFRDTIAYKPDLVIFYLGHNDFLGGNRFDDEVIRRKNENEDVKEKIRESRFLSWVVRQSYARKLDRKSGEDQVGHLKIETPPSGLGPELAVDRTSELYRKGVEVFRENLDKIIQLAETRKIPIFFYKPVGNLKDFPPSCSLHFHSTDDAKLKEWENFFEEGKKAQDAGDFSGALAYYENALSLDSDYAELNYRLAHVYLKQGELARAKQLFEQAKNNDCLIVRAPKDIQNVFDKIRDSGQAVVLDTEKILISEVPGGILGAPVVEDNVHFSVKGHSLLGRALAQEIADRDWLAPKAEWKFSKERSFDEIASELGVNKQLQFEAYLKTVSYFGSKFDSRILYAQKALELFPENPLALRHLAWAYWLKKDQAKAFAVYAQLQEISPKDFEEVMKQQPEIEKALDEQAA